MAIVAQKGQPIQVAPIAATAMALAIALALPACGAKPGPEIARSHASGSAAAERAYRAPPALVSASRTAGGRIALIGRAEPGSRVRVATPTGQAVTARADAGGLWRIVLPGAGEVRMFGLSMSEGERTVQSQGYLAVTPAGEVAQLRAGAGALVFIGAAGGLRLLAIDFDRQGAAVVSGSAGRRQGVAIAIDGAPRGLVAVDSSGRFGLALNEPLAAGDHRLELVQGAARSGASAAVSPAAPLAGGPFRAERMAAGWRIDWTTPGGGVQSTLLIAPGEGAP
jgi:hypothetical protein